MISIIIPVYNTEKTLERCLKSVLSQTYQNLEVICINDGSTDKSHEILKSYANTDSRIKIIDKKNGGMSLARNAGLDIASGDYIGFVDSDDFIEPAMFEYLLKEINLRVDMTGCGTNVIYEFWENIRKNDDKYFSIKLGRNVKVDSGLFSKMDVHIWNKLFKKDLIQKYKIRFPDGMYYEDAPFLLNYLSVTREVSFLDEKLYNYVRYEKSTMGETFKKTSRALDLIRVVDFSYDFFAKYNLGKNLKKDLADFHIRNVILCLKYTPEQNTIYSIKYAMNSLTKYGVSNLLFILVRFSIKFFKKMSGI